MLQYIRSQSSGRAHAAIVCRYTVAMTFYDTRSTHESSLLIQKHCDDSTVSNIALGAMGEVQKRSRFMPCFTNAITCLSVHSHLQFTLVPIRILYLMQVC